ncbi:diacylglycerol kinase family protein [Evansella cellulosilytica]|uniref:Diacylglycerol kinase n=1 Tax=Evansella cellulosilytica (strain ATCC 21833 / DSM 2522 / FERM P-1141 / JCM 9156 / N-4) TaxID=649639 RepID=E6TW45_EVAC2|nr:diacylglycerol kinase family protein [Evansella cellulosilytica]ADU29868.1 diacylglycerol kinase [Evansella cellulosilytica DSM 2522]
MGSKNNPFVSWNRVKKSFIYASTGMAHTWRNEQNFRIHTLIAVLVFIFAQVLQVPLIEQALLVIVIGGVLALELINTALEHSVDLIVQSYDTRAKIIKDAAAGAVFVFSITAVIVGAIIFIPKIIALFT